MIYGYARVSTTDQNLSRQLEQLKKENCNKIFKEKVSGKNIQDRTEIQKLLNTVTTGDTVVISSLDRLSRNYEDIKHLYNEIVNVKQCNLLVLDMPCLSANNDSLISKFMNELILNVLAFVSENEREKIRERQKQGMEVARAKNPYTTSLKLTESEFLYHYERVTAGEISVAQLCKDLNIKSRKTFYNLKKRYISEFDINVPELIKNRKSTK
jgi:DNA invertase Pin-like site-specific DNA recombinase